MELIVIRHAAAQAASAALEARLADAGRPLSDQGRRRFARAVRGLVRLDVRVDTLLHSPWLRAVETAEHLIPVLHGPSRVTSLLADEPSPELLEVLALCGGETVALVGHEPWLGRLCGWLVAGDREAGARFAFDKGGVARLLGDPRPSGMRLQAWLPAAVLARL